MTNIGNIKKGIVPKQGLVSEQKILIKVTQGNSHCHGLLVPKLAGFSYIEPYGLAGTSSYPFKVACDTEES